MGIKRRKEDYDGQFTSNRSKRAEGVNDKTDCKKEGRNSPLVKKEVDFMGYINYIGFMGYKKWR